MKPKACLSFLALLLITAVGFAQDDDVPAGEPHTLRPPSGVALAGEMMTLHTLSKRPFRAYVSGPDDAERGLLLVHEWWGLTEHVKAEADRYAALGYRVALVDLYNGKSTDISRIAADYMKSVDQLDANSKMRAALNFLTKPGRKLGALGWCFGGGQALEVAVSYPELVDAAVIYYGRPITEQNRLKRLGGPVLGIFAERDSWITPEKVEDFRSALDKAGSAYSIHSFPAGHAFANPSGKHYDGDIAREARALTDRFLRESLQ
ncbi:MAG: dienelactone hydrolase family protein [Gammaproteobacteria bacterium]|nr:dienelactone hydrolase family protein [Gammaproteobacteria bacterium]